MKKRLKTETMLHMVGLRFIRGFLAAFVPIFTTFAAMSPEQWGTAMVLSMALSGISGGLMAIDKWFREDLKLK